MPQQNFRPSLRSYVPWTVLASAAQLPANGQGRGFQILLSHPSARTFSKGFRPKPFLAKGECLLRKTLTLTLAGTHKKTQTRTTLKQNNRNDRNYTLQVGNKLLHKKFLQLTLCRGKSFLLLHTCSLCLSTTAHMSFWTNISNSECLFEN